MREHINTATAQGKNDRGVVSSEVAIMFPILVVIAMLAIFAARVSQQNAAVQSAVDAAARAASTQLDEGSATTKAQNVANANADLCDELTVDRFAWPNPTPLQPGVVTVEISCTVDNSSLGIGLGQRTITRTGVATVEFWRPTS